jgi:hypothetical protein
MFGVAKKLVEDEFTPTIKKISYFSNFPYKLFKQQKTTFRSQEILGVN